MVQLYYNEKATDEEALTQKLGEIDFEVTEGYILAYCKSSIYNRVKYLLFPKHIALKNKVLAELKALDAIKLRVSNKKPEQQLLVILGAINDAQTRLGSDTDSDLLYELGLVKDDLIQNISSNFGSIDVYKLMEEPNIINRLANEKYEEYVHELQLEG
jgi:hypothetical protein